MSAEAPCEYLRTAVALALWKFGNDDGRVRELAEESDNLPHVAHDQACIARALLRAMTGIDTVSPASTNLAEIAERAGGPDTICQAHLANALLTWPQVAWQFTPQLALGATEPLAWLTCAFATQLTGGGQGGLALLQRMARAADIETIGRLILGAKAG